MKLQHGIWVALTSISMDEPEPAEPASCKALATTCPTLVEGIKEI